jgi:hypothetical protein
MMGGKANLFLGSKDGIWDLTLFWPEPKQRLSFACVVSHFSELVLLAERLSRAGVPSEGLAPRSLARCLSA